MPDVAMVPVGTIARGPFIPPGGKVLIVLQENTGRVPLPDTVDSNLAQAVYRVIDGLAESFEDVKTTLQGAGKYSIVELLTDAACTRTRLLDCLVTHTKKQRTIDLLVLGHGSSETLQLHNEWLYGGENQNIRKLLSDANARGCQSINLRMVYMCNCYGSTVNDDWRAIGAKVSVGSRQNDYMPEPMITFFLHHWLAGRKVGEAAAEAYNQSIPLYTAVYPPTLTPVYRSESYNYPCGVEVDPANPFATRVKWCTGTTQVLDHFDTRQNSKITESQLVVSGDANITF